MIKDFVENFISYLKNNLNDGEETAIANYFYSDNENILQYPAVKIKYNGFSADEQYGYEEEGREHSFSLLFYYVGQQKVSLSKVDGFYKKINLLIKNYSFSGILRLWIIGGDGEEISEDIENKSNTKDIRKITINLSLRF